MKRDLRRRRVNRGAKDPSDVLVPGRVGSRLAGVGKRTLDEVVQGKFTHGAPQVATERADSERALPDSVRGSMGQSLGCDLSGVQIYEGSEASQAGAKAFARGNEVHFAAGEYNPGSRAGLELLGHELAHVAQQSEGRVGATKTLGKGMRVNDDPGLEREADERGAAAAAAVLAGGPTAGVTASAGPVASSAAAVAQGKFLSDGWVLGVDTAVTFIVGELGYTLDEVPEQLLGEITRIAQSKSEIREVDEYVAEARRRGWQRSQGEKKEARPERKQKEKLSPLLSTGMERGSGGETKEEKKEERKPNLKEEEEENESKLGGRGARVNTGAEKRIKKNKSLDLAAVFRALVAGKGIEVNDGHLEIVRRAHNAGQEAAQFAASQQAYQNLLVNTFGLSVAEIMNVHRSAGFEYEFGRFMDPEHPQISGDTELLRSHVTLALSPVFSPIFEGRAAYFRLETDSWNCLELVTPPFLVLICSDTGGLLVAMHELFSRTTLRLGNSMQSARFEDKEEDTSSSSSEEDDDEEVKKKKKEWEKREKERKKARGVPISEQLRLIADMLCPGTWTWEGQEPTPRFCFTYENAKRGKENTYGQVNISMTPEEIIKLAAVLPKWNLDQTSGMSSLVGSSLPSALFGRICESMMKVAGKTEDQRLIGAINLYARSTSNLIGIPSILYRSATSERPVEGNLATSIKETLLLWVKDFPHAVIADSLYGTDSAQHFTTVLEKTREQVWVDIKKILDINIREISREVTKKIDSYKELSFIKELTKEMSSREEKVSILKALKAGTHSMQTNLKKLVDGMPHLIETEYTKMVELHIGSIGGGEYVKMPIGHESSEEFGDGYGVRKDTYLGCLPGDRRLRVAEIRDTSHLERLKTIL